MPSPNFHLSAARAVMATVDGGRSLDDALAAQATRLPTRRRPQLREIGYGACRHYHRFDGMLAQLLDKPIKSRERVLHFILINACHQLEQMRVPDYAVLNESVAAVAGTRFAWAGNLLNGVLRNFIDRRARLEGELEPAARVSFPAWLYQEICTHWPGHCREVFAASNRKPPLTVRVNQRKLSRDACLAQFAGAGIKAFPTADGPLGITLAEPLPVAQIPGFSDGRVSVQDESAQLTAAALPLGAGERLLDGCAAPGGKTGLLLEAQGGLEALVAVDLPERMGRLGQNLTRLGLEGEVEAVAADMTQPETWWDGRRFDRILLDVPCSGSGVIRRHPDIKHHRRPQDLAQYAQRQLQLLTGAWPLLKNGGTLLYATCSILPAENDAVIEKFLRLQTGAQVDSVDAPPGIATRFGRQRLPGVHPGDGFYYCRLRNTATT